MITTIDLMLVGKLSNHMKTRVIELQPGAESVFCEVGAVEKIVLQICEKLINKDIFVALPDIRGNCEPSDLIHSRYLLYLPIRNPLGRSNSTKMRPVAVLRLLQLYFFFMFVPRFIALAKFQKYNIIHVHNTIHVPLVYLVKEIARLRVSIVYTTHSHSALMTERYKKRPLGTMTLEKISLRLADSIISPTQSVARVVTDSFKLPRRKVNILPAGIDIGEIDDYIRGHVRQKVNNLVICVARIHERKNQMALVKATELLVERCKMIRVILIGPLESSDYLREIQNYVSKRSLPIIYVGQVTRPQLLEYYSKAELMVFPTLQEVQGIVLLEAMAFGIPVVASDISPIRDIISIKPSSATLVNPDDSGELAAAMEKVLNDPSKSVNQTQNGRRLVEEKYTTTSMIIGLIDIFERPTR